MRHPETEVFNYYKAQCLSMNKGCVKPDCYYKEVCKPAIDAFPDGVPWCLVTRLRYGYCHKHDYRTKQCKTCRELVG